MPVYEFQAELAELREMRPSHRPVPTADGFIVLTIVSDLNWRAVARALGQPGLGTDPRFADVKARTLHWDELHQLVCDWAASRTAEQAEAEMLAAGVPAARYQTMASLLEDEHLRTRGVFRTVADPAGEFTGDRHAVPFRRRDHPAGRLGGARARRRHRRGAQGGRPLRHTLVSRAIRKAARHDRLASPTSWRSSRRRSPARPRSSRAAGSSPGGSSISGPAGWRPACSPRGCPATAAWPSTSATVPSTSSRSTRA